jgi:PAS domain S-box-containing protein
MRALLTRARAATGAAWLPVLVGVAGLAASIAFWRLFIGTERSEVINLSQAQTQTAAAKLERSFLALTKPLVAIAERHGPALREDRPWELQVTGLRWTLWAEPSGRVGWVRPLEGNESLAGADLTQDEVDRLALGRAAATGKPATTRFVTLPHGGSGFHLVIPVFDGQRLDGFFVVAYATDSLYPAIFADDVATGWSLAVLEGDRELYRHGAMVDSDGGGESAASFFDSTLRVRVAPGPVLASRLRSPLPRVILATGSVIALLLAAAVAFAQASWRRAREAERSQVALRESGARMRAILDAALDAVISMDAAGRVVSWNPRAAAIFGWTASEALGRTVAELVIPPRLRAEHERGLARFLATGEGPAIGRRVELSAVRRDGAEFPVELAITVIGNDDDRLFVAFVADISERKGAEGRLRTQLERLHLLDQITRAIGERQDLQSIFQVVIRELEDHLPIDLGCVCTYDAADETLTVQSLGTKGLGLAAALGLAVQSRIGIDENGLSRCVRGLLVYEADVGDATYPFLQQLAGGGLRSVVMAPLLVESQVFGVLFAARRAAHGFSSGDCEFLRQLSGHVALAAHQAQLHGALRLAYEDLRQTQQAVMQQERLRALGEMASGVAHDINNAISPVALYVESLLEREPGLSQRAREYLQIVQRAIDDVAHTIGSLREFYRQREPQLELARVDLNLLVEQVVDLTRARWSDMPQQRGVVIDLRTELAPGLPRVMGVEAEIREALVNLVFNAIDAMPDGGGLTLRTGIAGGRNALVEVVDSGIGMDEATRRRCLEPFFTTKGERGTGLGLAMVYGILQRHGGEVEVLSAPGAGTTVRLTLPLSPAAADAEAPAAAYRMPARLRVLVVDDDPLVLRALRAVLEGDGHHVAAVGDGRAAIDAFRAALGSAEAFEVVITDLGMPHLDGRQVAAAVKASSPATPVLLLTGWGQRLAAEGDAPAYVDRVLNKPPRIGELREALAAYGRPA